MNFKLNLSTKKLLMINNRRGKNICKKIADYNDNNNMTRIRDTNSRRLTHLQLNRGATLCTNQVDVRKERFIDVSVSRIKPAFACFSKRPNSFCLLCDS